MERPIQFHLFQLRISFITLSHKSLSARFLIIDSLASRGVSHFLREPLGVDIQNRRAVRRKEVLLLFDFFTDRQIPRIKTHNSFQIRNFLLGKLQSSDTTKRMPRYTQIEHVYINLGSCRAEQFSAEFRILHLPDQSFSLLLSDFKLTLSILNITEFMILIKYDFCLSILIDSVASRLVQKVWG